MSRTPWPVRIRRAKQLADAACEVLDVAADAAAQTGLDRTQSRHFVLAVLMTAMDGWGDATEEPKKQAVQLQQDWTREL